MTVKGTVSNTYEKAWDGKDGTVILHSFQLQGDRQYYRTGTDKLVSKNDAVSFDANGANVIPETLVKMEAAVQAAPPPSTGGRPTWGGGGGGFKQKQAEKDQYWSDKESRDIERERRQQEIVEPRITWSSARTAAIDVIGLALQHDALTFGNASKGAKLGMILDYIDEVSARFYHQSMAAADTATELAASAKDKPAAGKATTKGAPSDE